MGTEPVREDIREPDDEANEYLKLIKPDMPPHVVARLRVVHDTATRNMAAINAATSAAHWKSISRRVNEVVNSRRNVTHRIHALWIIADDSLKATKGHVGCKRGCNSCCHIAVGVLEPEARAIGERIGVKPADVLGRDDFKGFDWGAHNPCTFLKDGECSIYEHRPLACRTHFTLDDDATLCDVTDRQPWPVPYVNTHQWQTIMLQVMSASANDVPKLGDIREFFPRGRR